MLSATVFGLAFVWIGLVLLARPALLRLYRHFAKWPDPQSGRTWSRQWNGLLP